MSEEKAIILVLDYNLTDLETQLNKLVNLGYSPYGSLVVETVDGVTKYIQPMTILRLNR